MQSTIIKVRPAWNASNLGTYLGVDIGDVSALLRVVTLVDVVGPVEIPADDLSVVSALLGLHHAGIVLALDRCSQKQNISEAVGAYSRAKFG